MTREVNGHKEFIFDYHEVGMLGRTDKATFQIILRDTGEIFINIKHLAILDKSYFGLIDSVGNKTPLSLTVLDNVSYAYTDCLDCVVEDNSPAVDIFPSTVTPPTVSPPPEEDCKECEESMVIEIPKGLTMLTIKFI